MRLKFWTRTPSSPEIEEDPLPAGFDDWPVLDRLDYRMERMTTRISVGIVARRKLAKVVKQQRNGFIIFAILISIAFAGVAWNTAQNRENSKAGCESGNRRIRAERDADREDYKINDASAKAQGFAEDNPLRKFYKARLEWQLDEQHPYRDCDHLDVPIPYPDDPPSFEEALKAALKYDKNH